MLGNGIMYFDNQPYTGSVFGLYPSTNDTSEVAQYLAGKEDGLWRKYYEDGQVMEERLYDHGKKTGDYLAWWPNGNKKLHYRFVTTNTKVPVGNGTKVEGWCRK